MYIYIELRLSKRDSVRGYVEIHGDVYGDIGIWVYRNQGCLQRA